MIDCNHEALLWVADTSEVPDPDLCPDRLTRGYTPHGIFTASAHAMAYGAKLQRELERKQRKRNVRPWHVPNRATDR